MTPINISNCPTTGLTRKITSYDFLWFQELEQIIVDCKISYYNISGSIVSSLTNNPNSGRKKLIASDTLVDPTNNGSFLTEEQIQHNKTYNQQVTNYSSSYALYETAHVQWLLLDPEEWQGPGPFPSEPQPPTPVAPLIPSMKEYDFYVLVIGANPINLPLMIQSIISVRDSQGKFNNIIV